MSDSPLLNKMDALLKKHRGGDNSPEASSDRTDSPERTPPPNAWLPVLTQVIERGIRCSREITAAVVPVVLPQAVMRPGRGDELPDSRGGGRRQRG